MKIYFQIQSGRKMRVYKIVDGEKDENGKDTRKQETIGVINATDNKIPPSIYKHLSADEQLELKDRMRMLREQAEYEDTRKEIKRMPEILKKASALLLGNRITLTKDQQALLQSEMSVFLQHLQAQKGDAV